MVSKQELIRTKLQTKVFDVIGKTVTLISKSSPTYNTRGELESSTTANSSITIVPYNIFTERESYQRFGDLEEGDLDAAIPYTVTVNKDDVITMEGQNYTIKDIEQNYLPDNVVTIVRLTKEQN